MSEDIPQDHRRFRFTRRCFLGAAAATIAVVQFGVPSWADGESSMAKFTGRLLGGGHQ